ncbi:MAG: hypothetical protein ACREGJ_02325 [Candidatus Saccharimonadales bacterium]
MYTTSYTPEPEQQEPPSEQPKKVEHPATPAPVLHSRKATAVAVGLVLSVLLLLGAGGYVAWFFTKPAEQQTVSKPGEDAQLVKNASLVVPADLPATYAKRDYNIPGAAQVLYDDTAAGCSLVTSIITLGGPLGRAPKESVVNLSKKYDTDGVTTNAPTDGTEYKLKDATDQREYTFSSMHFTQDINLPGVDVKKKQSLLIYKRLGDQVAAITATCKADVWDAKKAEFEQLLAKFTVKAER